MAVIWEIAEDSGRAFLRLVAENQQTFEAWVLGRCHSHLWQLHVKLGETEIAKKHYVLAEEILTYANDEEGLAFLVEDMAK